MNTKARILRVSEKLFATQGIDTVSLRTISTAIGQKNKTAAQYHYGSKEGLIKAILLERMGEINCHRQRLLDELLESEINESINIHKLRQLVEVFFEPFVQLLLDDNGGRYYVRFTAQLFSQSKGMSLLTDAMQVFCTQDQLFKLIKIQLKDLPKQVLNQRLTLMAGLLAQAAAAKDYELDTIDQKHRKRHIKKFSNELVDFVVGGLSAPVM